MAIVANKSYWFKSKSDGKYLNPLTSGSLANSTNVTTYAKESGDASQIWICSYYSNSSLNLNGYLLKNAKNSNYALDRWRLSGDNYNNADIYTIGSSSEDLKDQLILIEETSNGCRIKLKYRNLYLTKTSTATYGGSNVNWKVEDGSNNQLWVAEEAPSEVVVTGMPSGAGYTNNTEYFHPDSGMVTGTWANNGGSTKASQIKQFYKTVYNQTADPSNNQCLHSLYGGKYVDSVPKYGGQFHPGIDIFKSAGSNIYAARSGVIRAVGSFYVTVETSNCLMIYVHLLPNSNLSNGNTVTAGSTLLGTEDKLETSDYHLHIEIHPKSGSLSPHNPTPTVFDSMSCLVPYNYLND